MTLRKRGEHWYGDDQEDVRAELVRYSTENGYPAEYFRQAQCSDCGGLVFSLAVDDNEGCAIRTCASCKSEHYIGDSADYAEEAELEDCACPCGAESFQITAGVHLYPDSNDVMWLYLGLLCPACSLTAVYGDWQSEYEGYEAFLALV